MSDLRLDATQLDRYSRHVIMEELGPEGQARLLEGSALVVGAGGLGSPVLQYLSAAGVGRIGIVDDDVVERSNLQRQVIHGEDDIGRPKVRSAAEAIRALNPDVEVETHERRLTASSIDAVAADHDLIVDASDNFATRFLLNDFGVLTDRPVCHGAIYRLEGQILTVAPGDETPCYRCLFPEAPGPGVVPDCAETGVLGVLPGTVGCLQATEAVKWLTGIGDPLDDRLLRYDAAAMTTDTVPVRPDPNCPVCGDHPRIESLSDVSYEGRCRAVAE